MQKKIRKVFTLFLAFVMLLSLVSPAMGMLTMASAEEGNVSDGDLLASSYLSTSSFDNFSWERQSEQTSSSGEAIKIECTTAGTAEWPYFYLSLSEPISPEADVLCMDVLRTGAARLYSVNFYDKDNKQLGTTGTVRPFDNNAWNTTQYELERFGLTEETIPQIKLIRLNLNFPKKDGATVVGEAVYLDNAYFVNGDDLLSGSRLEFDKSAVSNLSATVQQNDICGSASALKVQATASNPSAEPILDISPVAAPADAGAIRMDIKLDGAKNTLKLSALNASGTELGSVTFTPAGTGWNSYAAIFGEMGITEAEIAQIAKLRLKFSFDSVASAVGANICLDNLKFIPGDTDLLSNAVLSTESFGNYSKEMQTEQTRNSLEAIKITCTTAGTAQWPSLDLTLNAPLSADVDVFCVDVLRTGTGKLYSVAFYNSEGTQIGKTGTVRGLENTGWNTTQYELARFGLTEENIPQIAKIRLNLYFPKSGSATVVGEAVYLDNIRFEKGDDLLSSTRLEFDNNAIKDLSAVVQQEDTCGSVSALKVQAISATPSAWPNVVLSPVTVPAGAAGISMDVKLDGAKSYLTVEALNSSGTVLGDHKYTPCEEGWKNYIFSFADMELTQEQISKIAKLCIRLNFDSAASAVGASICMDNAKFITGDDDLMATHAVTEWYSITKANGLVGVRQGAQTNGSTEAIRVSAVNTTPAKWPRVYFDMTGAIDETVAGFKLDAKLDGAMNYLGIMAEDADGNELGSYTYKALSSNWKTYYFAFENMGISQDQAGQIAKVAITLQFDNTASKVGASIYLDNLKFIYDNVWQSELDSDMLADAKYVWGGFETNIYSYDTQCEEVTGEKSLYSLKLASTDEEGSGWPQAQFRLTKSYDLTDKELVMDVKFAGCNQTLGVSVLDSNYKTIAYYAITGDGSEDWQTLAFDYTAYLSDGYNLSDVRLIQFAVNFDQNNGTAQTIYIDNVRTEVLERAEKENDLLAVAPYTFLTAGENLNRDKQSPVVYGDSSRYSTHIQALPGYSGWPTFQFQLPKAYDLSNAKLVYNAKFENTDAINDIKVYDSDWKNIGGRYSGIASQPDENGWYTVTVDLAETLTDADLTDVLLIALGYDFKSNTDLERNVYIDNVRLVFENDGAAGVTVNSVYNTDNYQLTDSVTGGSTLSFHSAKGEIESGQFVITPDANVAAYGICVTDAISAGGNVIPASAFEIFAVDYIAVTDAANGGENGMFPDALIPFFNYKNQKDNKITKGENQGIWINLNVAEDMAAGEYTGSVLLTMNGIVVEIPMEITVYDVQLPEQVNAQSAFMLWYGHIALGEGTDSEALQQAYYDYLVTKRVMPNMPANYITADVQTYVNYIAENLANNPKIASYALPYAKDASGMLDANAVTQVLTALINKNIELRQAGEENTDLFAKAYFYLANIIDEPTANQYEQVLACDRIISDAKAALVSRLEGYPDLQESFLNINHIVTTSYKEALSSGDITFCSKFNGFDEADYAGEEVWWYGCVSPNTPYPTYHLNDELITSRVLSWMQYDYHVSGNLYWCVNYFKDRIDGQETVRDVWNDPSPLAGTPGDGYLLYPGTDYNVFGPIGTMRLESIREGNEDYEYFLMFAQYIAQYNAANSAALDADELLQTYFTGLYDGMYPNADSALFAQQRISLLEMLEKMGDDLNAAVESMLPEQNIGTVEKWNISLGDNLDLKFYVKLNAAVEQDAYMNIAIGSGEPVSYKVSEASKDSDGNYIFVVELAAAQMTENVTLQLQAGEKLDEAKTYSVLEYANTILTDATQEKYHALVKEMLNYGGKAQKYFAYYTDKLADESVMVTGATVPTQNETDITVSGTLEGIRFYGATLLFKSKTAIRYYFTVTGNIADYTFTAAGAEAQAVEKDGLYYVEIAGITPQNLNEICEVNVSDGTNTLQVSYSPMHYIVRMYNGTGSENLKNLLQAMYGYHLAAKALISL